MNRQPTKDEIRRAIEEARGSDADIGMLRLKLLGPSYALDYIMAYPEKKILKALVDLGWGIKSCEECRQFFIPARRKYQRFHSLKCKNRWHQRERRRQQKLRTGGAHGTPTMV